VVLVNEQQQLVQLRVPDGAVIVAQVLSEELPSVGVSSLTGVRVRPPTSWMKRSASNRVSPSPSGALLRMPGTA
jgi:hypothetical protein